MDLQSCVWVRPHGASRAAHATAGVLLTAAAVLALSGCGTGGLAVKKDIWDTQASFERRQAGLSEKVLALEGRIDGLEAEVSALTYTVKELGGELNSLRGEFSKGLEAVRDGQQELGIELEKKIRDEGAVRTHDREDMLARMEIVLEEVTRENKRLTEELDAIRSSVAVGYNHVVQRGETLGEIAARYGITVEEIVSANEISDRDRIARGQKLFIPEKK